ncbi:MAG: hypothetical protein ACRC33_08050 [Gemmataceae bacterium]
MELDAGGRHHIAFDDEANVLHVGEDIDQQLDDLGEPRLATLLEGRRLAGRVIEADEPLLSVDQWDITEEGRTPVRPFFGDRA